MDDDNIIKFQQQNTNIFRALRQLEVLFETLHDKGGKPLYNRHVFAKLINLSNDLEAILLEDLDPQSEVLIPCFK